MVNIIENIRNYVSQTTSFVFFIVCLVLLLLDVIFFAIKSEDFPGFVCVSVSTIIACLIMIPLTFSFEKLIDAKAKNLALNGIESDNASIENQKLKIENDNLKRQLNNLECAQVSAMSFERIAELALLKTNLLQTKVYKEQIGEIQKAASIDMFKDFYYDENLLICNYDIEAKFGIDIRNIKIRKVNDKTISVSGITPTFIGASKNITSTPVSEIRRVNIDKNNHIKSVEVKNDSNSKQDIARFADEKNKEYQESLRDMKNFEFFDDAIVALAENFIKIIFAPVYDSIVFDDEEVDGALSIEDFIKEEIKVVKTEIEKNEV